MAAIANPNPITPSVADKIWLTHFAMTKATMVALAQPWDAVNNLLVGNPSDGQKIHSLLHDTKEAAAKAVADELIVQLAQLGGTTADKFVMLQVNASDPSKPVSAVARFSDPDHREHKIADLFETIAGDMLLAAAYASVLGWAAGKLGSD